MKANTLMWFRMDLRLADNAALCAAVEAARSQGGRVQALFCVTPAQWEQHDMAAVQLDFIERHVNLLARSLAVLGIPLQVLHLGNYAAIPEAIASFCREQQIGAIFAHAEPEINEVERDADVAAVLQRDGVGFELFEGHCLVPPGLVLNRSGQMFRVFTPFAKVWRRHLLALPTSPLPVPEPVGARLPDPAPIHFNCATQSSTLWQAGECHARRILMGFVDSALVDYHEQRDFPATDGTSALSPYLAIGVLSPCQCLAAVLMRFPEALMEGGGLSSRGAYIWLTELCWRDFYRHLLVAFPTLCKGKNFNSLADAIQWRNDPEEFRRWCEGATGYPIVDAAMRQLNQTGWMHNRLRMIVASFLTKHLLIDWRWGERYFRRHLIDGDLAANNGGWQWSAGTGCDAQPYFRVFNPISQSEKFDPEGKFIRKLLPQLAQVATPALHRAEIHSADLFAVNQNYPTPVVEHRRARERALAALGVMKRASSTAKVTPGRRAI
ncbi:MAG: deoxyribodipyrimidine photo-lyase [Shewanella sp.]|nr:deoxyribodipyrimidine photo-lyase [Shewanella sp.]MCF1429884.1 deoxyribodipyrimidine photo-lyase [Shewanella sp.]MCF1438476.1 deoxyribodipyrimidine photo-lyase [Shewanella sp.]MCF1457793.1 deoxyribodipyrimidine photo-lyase [Shewanella sp.]